MSREKGWEQLFRNHEVHKLIGQVEAELEKLQEQAEDSQWDELILRVTAALTVVRRTMDSAVPALFHGAAMRSIQGGLQNTLNAIRHYLANPDQRQHLSGVEAHIDDLMLHIRSVPVQTPAITGDVFSATAERYREQVESALQQLSAKFRDREEGLERLDGELSDAGEEIQSLVTQIESFKSTLSSAATDQAEKNKVVFKALVEGIDEQADALLKKISSEYAKAQTILGLISEEALTTDYAKSAGAEEASANRYRWASIGFMVFAVATLVWLVYDISKLGFTIGSTISRLLIGAVLFLPAAYLARESQQHRARSNYYKGVSLELSVLGPFIQDLDEDKRKSITENLVGKYFGRFSEDQVSKPRQKE